MNQETEGPDSVMVDIESMGVNENAALIQVGAALFNFDGRPVFAPSPMFQQNIDLMSSLQAGGIVDQSTVRWWNDRGGFPSDPKQPPANIRIVLGRFADWLGRFPSVKEVWAQGSQFDLAVLQGYFRRLNIECPWAYHAGRDTRTVYALAKRKGWKKPAGEPSHAALQDCLDQIVTLRSACVFLDSWTPPGKPADAWDYPKHPAHTVTVLKQLLGDKLDAHTEARLRTLCDELVTG